jgi:hypothetical protein
MNWLFLGGWTKFIECCGRGGLQASIGVGKTATLYKSETERDFHRLLLLVFSGEDEGDGNPPVFFNWCLSGHWESKGRECPGGEGGEKGQSITEGINRELQNK